MGLSCRSRPPRTRAPRRSLHRPHVAAAGGLHERRQEVVLPSRGGDAAGDDVGLLFAAVSGGGLDALQHAAGEQREGRGPIGGCVVVEDEGEAAFVPRVADDPAARPVRTLPSVSRAWVVRCSRASSGSERISVCGVMGAAAEGAGSMARAAGREDSSSRMMSSASEEGCAGGSWALVSVVLGLPGAGVVAGAVAGAGAWASPRGRSTP